ncbi:MAG TPA: hypothetical protein VH396_10240 [Chitinophagaceae bacterium]
MSHRLLLHSVQSSWHGLLLVQSSPVALTKRIILSFKPAIKREITKNNKPMETKWKIFIAIIFFWVAMGAGLILTINLTTSQADKLLESVKTAFLILGGLGVVLPTYLNAWHAVEGEETLKEKLEFDRVENSFRIIEQWDDSHLKEARELTRDILKNKKKI